MFWEETKPEKINMSTFLFLSYKFAFKEWLRSSDKLFRNHDFFSEKIIVGPQEGEIPPPLAQMVLTQCISISELLVHHMAPPGGQI